MRIIACNQMWHHLALAVLSVHAFTVALISDAPSPDLVLKSTTHDVILKIWDDTQDDLRDWVSENRVKYVHNLSSSVKAAYYLGLLKREFDLVVSVGDLKSAERLGALYPFLTSQQLNEVTISVLKAFLKARSALRLSNKLGGG
jgi:hypothetical protein